MTGFNSSKPGIRARSLRLRDDLTAQKRAQYSREIVKNLTALTCYQEAEVLLAYASYRSEVETAGLIRQALSEGRQVFVPRVDGKDMEFWQIKDLTDLHSGYRGIPEPDPVLSYYAFLAAKGSMPHTLMCMPGAAFDRAHHRIGYGGGFYDRYLYRLVNGPVQEGLPFTTAALAYTCQVFDEIPWESHDITPDILLTQQGLL